MAVRWKRRTFGILGWLVAATAGAVDCSLRRVDKLEYTVCVVDTRHESLQVVYADASGRRYGSFARLRAALENDGLALQFAMNAGMFHPDFAPVGLLVLDSREISPLNREQRSGNFFIQPNGVFFMDADGAHVVTTEDYAGLLPRFASQSGPMLVHRGAIPATAAFRAGSRSRHVRNGVCARDGKAIFAISESRVNFHEFASLFSHELGCEDALYFDGSISSLYSRELGRSDERAELGPIVVVVERLRR